jgi:hypothetical protein
MAHVREAGWLTALADAEILAPSTRESECTTPGDDDGGG